MIVEQVVKSIESINELSQPVNKLIRRLDIDVRDSIKDYGHKVQWFVRNVMLEIDYQFEKETNLEWEFGYNFSNKNIYLSFDGKTWTTNKKKNGGLTAVIRGNTALGNSDGKLEIALVMGMDHIYTMTGQGKLISKKSNKNDIAKDVLAYYISIKRELGR